MAEKNSLWKNIRNKAKQNRASGAKPKQPTTEMLRQERKIKAKQYAEGSFVGEDDVPYRQPSMPMENYEWKDRPEKHVQESVKKTTYNKPKSKEQNKSSKDWKEDLYLTEQQLQNQTLRKKGTPYNLPKTSEHLQAIGENWFDPNRVNSVGENLIEAVDLSGITSWDDASTSYNSKNPTSFESISNYGSVIPVLGRIPQATKSVLRGWNGINSVWDVSKDNYAEGGEDDRKKRELAKRNDNTDAVTREASQGLGFLAQLSEDFDNAVAPYIPTGDLAKQYYYNNYSPVEYPNPINAAVPVLKTAWNLINPATSIGREQLKAKLTSLSTPNRPIGLDKEGNPNIGEEAWKKALGLPTKEKYIVKSQYKPSSASDSNAEYYTINPNVIDKQKIIDYVKSEDFMKRSSEGKSPNSRVTNMDTFSDFVQDDFITKEGYKQGIEDYYQIDPIQKFQISKAWDPEKKKWYASIYDKYDFDSKSANKAIKPYEIYDRVYYDSNEKPTVEKQSTASKVAQAYGNPFPKKKAEGGYTNPYNQYQDDPYLNYAGGGYTMYAGGGRGWKKFGNTVADIGLGIGDVALGAVGSVTGIKSLQDTIGTKAYHNDDFDTGANFVGKLAGTALKYIPVTAPFAQAAGVVGGVANAAIGIDKKYYDPSKHQNDLDKAGDIVNLAGNVGTMFVNPSGAAKEGAAAAKGIYGVSDVAAKAGQVGKIANTTTTTVQAANTANQIGQAANTAASAVNTASNIAETAKAASNIGEVVQQANTVADVGKAVTTAAPVVDSANKLSSGLKYGEGYYDAVGTANKVSKYGSAAQNIASVAQPIMQQQQQVQQQKQQQALAETSVSTEPMYSKPDANTPYAGIVPPTITTGISDPSAYTFGYTTPSNNFYMSQGGNITNNSLNLRNTMRYKRFAKGGTFDQFGINMIPESAGLHHESAYGGVPIGPDALAEGGEAKLQMADGGQYIVSGEVDGANTQSINGETMTQRLKKKLKPFMMGGLASNPKDRENVRRPFDSYSKEAIDQAKNAAVQETEAVKMQRGGAVQYAAHGGKLTKDIEKIVMEEYTAAYGGTLPNKYKGKVNMPNSYAKGGNIQQVAKQILASKGGYVHNQMTQPMLAEGGPIYGDPASEYVYARGGMYGDPYARGGQIDYTNDMYSSYAGGGPLVGNVKQPFNGPAAQNRGGMLMNYADGGMMPPEQQMMQEQQQASQEQMQQQGGQDQMMQIVQQIAQAIMQGENPEQIMAELANSGMPQEQVQQVMQAAMQMADQQQQQQPMQGQEQMMPPQGMMARGGRMRYDGGGTFGPITELEAIASGYQPSFQDEIDYTQMPDVDNLSNLNRLNPNIGGMLSEIFKSSPQTNYPPELPNNQLTDLSKVPSQQYTPFYFDPNANPGDETTMPDGTTFDGNVYNSQTPIDHYYSNQDVLTGFSNRYPGDTTSNNVNKNKDTPWSKEPFYSKAARYSQAIPGIAATITGMKNKKRTLSPTMMAAQKVNYEPERIVDRKESRRAYSAYADKARNMGNQGYANMKDALLNSNAALAGRISESVMREANTNAQLAQQADLTNVANRNQFKQLNEQMFQNAQTQALAGLGDTTGKLANTAQQERKQYLQEWIAKNRLKTRNYSTADSGQDLYRGTDGNLYDAEGNIVGQ